MSGIQTQTSGRQSTPNRPLHAFQPAPGRVTMRFDKPDMHAEPFERSLQLILQAILRDQSAASVCLYEWVPPGNLILRDYVGASQERLQSASLELSPDASRWLADLRRPAHITDARTDPRVGDFPEVLLHSLQTLDVVPLLTGDTLRGFVTSGQRTASGAEQDQAQTRLQRLSTCVAALLARGGRASMAIHLISRIARVESDLADWKIAERTLGLLNDQEWTEQAAWTLQEHVERVLDAPDRTGELPNHLAQLEATLNDRKLLSEAKRHLQKTRGLSEEQAYLYLRNTSRRNRQRLRDLAQSLLQGGVPRACGSEELVTGQGTGQASRITNG